MWAWIFFVLLLVWYAASMIHSARRLNALESYVIFLLLSDDIRADHKRKLLEWISNSKETRAENLRVEAGALLRILAGSIAGKGALLSSAALLWNCKKDLHNTGAERS